ncbi:hypothetical protein HOJ44_03840 [Candidatus Bathyarchaeota archaeon]|nr:hypothetical protein [Candidatus Bathyarchaeota archaeon]
MELFEALGYVFIFGYMAFGLGYFLSRSLNEVYFDNKFSLSIPAFGINETTTIDIDHLFEENGITQIDQASE